MQHLLLITLLLFSANAISAPNIVISISPIHSLISNITQGVTTPKLLLKSNQSAHHTHLIPSQLSMIEQADLVVIMHSDFEQGLARALSQINNKKIFSVDSNTDDDHEIHNNIHSHDDDHDTINHHSWLDINHMQIFAKKITHKLSLIDPNNQAIYQENYIKLNQQLEALKNNIKQLLANSKQPIASYSNAFEYFIHANGLVQKTLITSKHEERLSIYKIIKAKKSMRENQVKCLLGTVDVPLKRIKVLTEGLNINAVRIDIIGRELTSDKNQYFKLMTNIASQISQCLK